MVSPRKAPAGLLATLQIAWSFSAGTGEILAQSRMAPVRVPVCASMVLVSAVGDLTITTPSIYQISRVPSLIESAFPTPVNVANPVPTHATAPQALPPADTLHLQDASRGVPMEDSIQTSAAAFAAIYDEKLINGETALDAPQVDILGPPQSPERRKLLIERALQTYSAVQDDHAHKKNYSDFHVHSAVELSDDRWFSAGNVELRRELTLCAERAAVVAALGNSTLAQIVRTIVVSNSGGEFKKLCAECLGWLATGKYFSPDTEIVSVARDAASGRFSLKIRSRKSVLPFHARDVGLPSIAPGSIASLALTLSPRAKSLTPSARELRRLMAQARAAYDGRSAEQFSPNPAAAAVSLTPFGRSSAIRFQWAPRFSEAEDLQAAATALERVVHAQTRLRPIVRFLDRATFRVMRLEERLLSTPQITALAYYGKDVDLPRIPSFGRLVKQGATRDTLILRIENDRLVVRTLDEYFPEIYGLP